MEINKEPRTRPVNKGIPCTKKGPNIVAGDFVQTRMLLQ